MMRQFVAFSIRVQMRFPRCLRDVASIEDQVRFRARDCVNRPCGVRVALVLRDVSDAAFVLRIQSD